MNLPAFFDKIFSITVNDGEDFVKMSRLFDDEELTRAIHTFVTTFDLNLYDMGARSVGKSLLAAAKVFQQLKILYVLTYYTQKCAKNKNQIIEGVLQFFTDLELHHPSPATVQHALLMTLNQLRKHDIPNWALAASVGVTYLFKVLNNMADVVGEKELALFCDFLEDSVMIDAVHQYYSPDLIFIRKSHSLSASK